MEMKPPRIIRNRMTIEELTLVDDFNDRSELVVVVLRKLKRIDMGRESIGITGMFQVERV